MDSKVEACKNLYNHSCGGWLAMFPKPPATRLRWNPQEELSLRLAETVRDVIATLPHPTLTKSVTWKMKYFYDSCMALDNVETDGKRPIKQIINELGGWSVLREFQVLSWDFSQTLVRLHADHGVSPFFKVSVVPHPYNSSRTIIQLSPSPLGLPHQSFYQHNEGKMALSYKNYMKDVVTLLGATSTDGKVFSEDMFYFERRIAEALPPTHILHDYRTHKILNVTQLKAVAQSIPIHELLSALLPSANIGDTTPLLVTSSAYMTALSNIISTTDRSALNNYVMWQLAKQYLPYLSQDLQDIHFVYLRDTTGVSEPMERWEFCVKTLLQYQGLTVAARLQRSTAEPERQQIKQLVGEMFENVRWAVKDSVTKAEWVELELYQHIVKKLDTLKLEVGVNDFYLDDSHLDDFYTKLFVQKNDLFQNIRYGVAYLREDMQRRFLTPKPEYSWLGDTINPEVKYVPSANTILVPSTSLREPWVHPDYPPGLLYGGLGVRMGHAILSSILPPYGLYGANGSLVALTGLVANLTRSSIEPQLSCLLRNSSDQALSTFTSLSAVRQAIKGLKRHTKGQISKAQPGLEGLSDSRLLVLRYSQSECVVQTPQDAAVQAATAAPIIGETLLTSLINNVKAVTDTLGCSAPHDPCKYLL